MVLIVDRLFGVIPSTSMYAILDRNISLKPSPILLEALSNLPEGTRVGVDRLSPKEQKSLEEMAHDRVDTGPDPLGARYWDAIITHCDNRKLEVAYLDNLYLWRAYANLSVKAYNAEYKKKWKDLEELRKLKIEGHGVDTEAQNIKFIQREAKILEMIVESEPAVVILERDTADYFASEAEMVGANGLNFRSYEAEKLPDLRSIKDMIYDFRRKYTDEELYQAVQHNKFSHSPYPRQEAIAKHVTVKRQYKALKEGRVTDEEPDFIGTWDIDVPAKSIFEMFIEKKDGASVSGRIEDTLGTAEFSGSIERPGVITHIKFTKIYNKSATLVGAVPHKIYYSGRSDNEDMVSGTFGYTDCTSLGCICEESGKFEMKPFKKEDAKVLVTR